MTDVSKKTVAVVGLGYVGLPLALAFGRKINTIGFDISEPKLKAYREGFDPTGEMAPEAFTAASRLSYTSNGKDLAAADYVVVAVPTPIDNAKQPDPRAELGQAIYMLLSGFVSIAEWASAPLMVEAERYGYDAAYVYFGVLSELADLARNMINEEEVDTVLYSYTSAWEGMLIICQCHGWDVAALVDDTCAAFEAKHMEAQP